MRNAGFAIDGRMMHCFARPKLLAMLLLAWSTLTPCARAVEPVEEFLEALWQRHYYDEALDYLDVLPSIEALPESVKQRALFERGRTLAASAAGQAEADARNILFSQAAEAFEKFQQTFPQHELAASAKNQIANILVERGRAEAQSAKNGDDKPAQLTKARDYFEQARRQFDAAEKQLDGERQKLPKLVEEKAIQDQKRQLAGDLAQVRMLRASVDYELAKTFEAGSKEANKHLQAAARSYASLYESYRTRAAGLLARLWEGRCYQEMGQFKQAVGCYRELMDLPTTADTRTIKAKSTRHALECWTHDSEQKYPEAIERGEKWEKEVGPAGGDADSLAIRYLTALAYQAQSNALPDKDPNRKKLAGFARQVVGPVATQPGEFQRPAKMLLVALAAPKDKDKDKDKGKKDAGGDSSSFSEPFERGKQALEKMQEAAAALKAAQASGDKAAVAAAQKAKTEQTTLARRELLTAINASDAKTPLEDLNSARYYVCFLAWDGGQLYDAAVLGEFLATRYPDSLPGRQGARIALAAFVRLYGESKATHKGFEMAQIERVANTIFKRWPGEEEADDAALTLLNFAAAERKLDKAMEYLGKVSANSPRRGLAEMRAGQTLWSSYLRTLQLPAEERPSQEELDKIKKQAAEVLAGGIAKATKNAGDQVDPNLPGAAFAMAQIECDAGHPDKAIEWLEDAKFGPLTLIKAGSPAAAREGFATETYKVALRAYIAATPQQLKKAEAVMDSLDKVVRASGDAKAADSLTAIYISLGRELQQQLSELRKNGKRKEMESVSKAFEAFLDRITKRDPSTSYASLNWIGETYYSLGAGFDEGGTSQSPLAKEYFEKAMEAYQKMLEIALKDPKYKDSPESLLGIRLRLADCYRRVGKYDEAIRTMLVVLREKPALITAQVQAAEIYQSRGATDSRAYALAINGSDAGKDGANVIWGWRKLSKMTMNNPKFAETFHQARLNMSEARHLFALTQQEGPQRTKILENAKQDLWLTYELHPDLGGEATAARYDRLLKQIQKSLGNKETGLKEFKDRETTATKTG